MTIRATVSALIGPPRSLTNTKGLSVTSRSFRRPATSSRSSVWVLSSLILHPLDVEGLGSGVVEVELGPARQPGFLGAEAMPIYQPEQHDIAERVAATLAGGDDQPVHLVGPQIIALPSEGAFQTTCGLLPLEMVWRIARTP